ncbi:unnamed protein product [Caenorhabditis bovis]|uniref:GDP-fucose protein O-fucosyltransferase 2 n=1 Tax=Caenorhabditis bovis TaxID=2654633 RepID=A0A8S1ETW9_9PELO|nr:unnamed protein product [Caenorhabditis bovis]
MRVFLAFLPILMVFAESDIDGPNDLLSKVDHSQFSLAKSRRFLIYECNPGEGFNLRRDVYMRIANAVRLLRDAGENFILVLPPWGNLFHWDRHELALPWAMFFDVESLNRFVPVVEFDEFLNEIGNDRIDAVVYLQHYAEGWGTEFVRKFDERPCQPPSDRFYKKQSDNTWKSWFFSYEQVRAENFKCVSFQGDSETLKRMILSNFSDSTSIMIDRAETVLHEHYGEVDYWRARRSMRYSELLIAIGNEFREKFLESTDRMDKTIMEQDWTKERARRNAIGGPYIGVHWRRRDFVNARSNELPSIKGTAKLINSLSKKLELSKVYLATDAPQREIDEMKSHLDENLEVFRFSDETGMLNDGQIAIIDQWICAHARFFTGSHESTFSFRIQEDREILGFPPTTTFNRLCPDTNADCQQPTEWKIVYA